MAPRRWWHRLTAGSVRANLVIVDLQSRRADELAKAAEPEEASGADAAAAPAAHDEKGDEDGEETATGNVTDQDVAKFIHMHKKTGIWTRLFSSGGVVSKLEGLLHQAVVEKKALSVARADREAAVSELAAMHADTQVMQQGDYANTDDARKRAEAKVESANVNLAKKEADWAKLKRERDAEYHRVKKLITASA